MSVSTVTVESTAGSRDTMDSQMTLGRSASRGAARLLKSRTQGPVRYPPYEQVDAAAMREMARFHVTPLGQIQQCCEHIPYNSSKRNFFEKTGRESIEAFGYEFQVPGQQAQAPYKVMWDYNIGIVRMTPFFKCLGYPKMLDKNPGLREASPSITGGAVSAQGYWVPYECARAICATFCHDIAGALIPLFGPDFPSECTPPESPFFGDMVIGQQLVLSARLESDASRRAYEARKGAAAAVPAGQRWLDGSVFPRPYCNEYGAPWLFQSPRIAMPAAAAATAMPVVSWNPLAPHPGAISRAEASAETRHLPNRTSDSTRLPPMSLPDREHQPIHITHRLRDPGTLVASGPTADAWVVKRRRPDQDHLDNAYALARANAARLVLNAPTQEGDGNHSPGGDAETAQNGNDDYAAAAVLVELKKEDQDAAAHHACRDPQIAAAGHLGPRKRHRTGLC